MKPGNLQLQGAKSGGANRKMRFLCSLQPAEIRRVFYASKTQPQHRKDESNGKAYLYIGIRYRGTSR